MTTGEVQVHEFNIEPTLATRQGLTGGYIEPVPRSYFEQEDWFNKAHKNVEMVWCDEEGGIKQGAKINTFFPVLNGRSLYGNVVVEELVKS